MALEHFRVCTKYTGFEWQKLVDRSRLLESISYVDPEETKNEDYAISKFFLQPFDREMNERTKIRHISTSIKSLMKIISAFLQLGSPYVKFSLNRKTYKKLMYEMYHYCDCPDSTPVNVSRFGNTLKILLSSKGSTFQVIQNQMLIYSSRLPNSPRAATLMFQVVTTISLIIDTADHMISFLAIYPKTEEELMKVLTTLTEPSRFKYFFTVHYEAEAETNLKIIIDREALGIKESVFRIQLNKDSQ